MKNLFSIGEVSKIKEVTIKALRYYHKVGILIPKYIDETSGYRYYSIDQFIYIDIIKGCRALGTSIEELKEIFKERNTDKLLKFLHMKRHEAEENISKMNGIIKNIDKLNSAVEYSKETLKNHEITIRDFHKRYIIIVPCKEAGSLKELLYYSELDKIIEDKKVEATLERGIIYTFDSEENIKPKYAFNGLKNHNNIETKPYIKMLPKGKYLTLNYSKENEKHRRIILFNYIKKHNLNINTFIEVELFNDFFNTESYSCEIQVLIENNKIQ